MKKKSITNINKNDCEIRKCMEQIVTEIQSQEKCSLHLLFYFRKSPHLLLKAV